MSDNPIKRLRDAADAVMAHQWSGNRERMNALHELCQAEIAATEALEAQAKRIAELEAALQSEKDEVFRLQTSHSALYARVQKLEADARRYRWLRDVGDATWVPMGKRYGVRFTHDIDAAIDAALKEKQ